ncbi:hypothetical protein ACHAQA_004241 [Verticillium albo-atrum]
MSHYADTPNLFPLHGGCACAHIRYTLTTAPLAVHACHCPLCQRESGSAFTLNAVIETKHIVLQPSATPTLPGTDSPLGPVPAASPFATAAAAPEGSALDAAAAAATVPCPTPTASHAPQTIHRCPLCAVAVWSFYGASTGPVAYLRTATLDRPAALDPDAHIFVRAKRDFVVLAPEVKQFPAHYPPGDVYRPEAMARLRAVRGGE